jgi:hypothetical protein
MKFTFLFAIVFGILKIFEYIDLSWIFLLCIVYVIALKELFVKLKL